MNLEEKKIEELRLSVSKTKTFIDCKKKFKFTYIQKLPRKTWEFHLFGQFCHKVLEDFHRAYIIGKSKNPYHIEMEIAFKAALIEFKGRMTKQMKKDCWDIINGYLKLLLKNKMPNVIDVEKNFNLNIGENIILNGMIDRIQIDDDNIIHVADYKTTKNKKYLKNDWFQLLTYAYVLLLEDPTITKVRASYILLRHDFEYVTTEFSVPEILKIKDKYEEYASQIRTETEYPPNPTALCNFCDHLDICSEGKAKSYSKNTFGEVNW